MNSDSHDDALSPALRAALGELRGVRAPAELAARVTMARAGRVSAPPELWERVAAELAPEFGQKTEPRGRLLRWTPRLAAAAGLVAMGWLGWSAWSGGDEPAMGPGDWTVAGPAPSLAEPLPAERRSEILAQFAVVDVPPARLAPAARAWAGFLSGPADAGLAAPMPEEG